MIHNSKNAFLFLIFIGLFFSFVLSGNVTDASRIDDLKNQRQEKEQAIAALEEEIRAYQNTILETEKESDSFQKEIARLNATIKKLRADITVTERRIEFTEILIETLSLEIRNKEKQITKDRVLLSEFIREIHETSNQSLIEVLLANASLSDFFSVLQHYNTLQALTQQKLSELRATKAVLEEEEIARIQEQSRLVVLAEELEDRTAIEEGAHNEKTYLLQATKEKEAQYRTLLEERLKKREALEAEIRKLEDEIRIAIDPASLPKTRSGILGWPLKDLSLDSCWKGGVDAKNCVTQFFGNTNFATKNPQVYSGEGHNGIDFRATTGTSLYASEEGTIRAVGDTDVQCRGVSYGKWILIDHPNNLSTLYAHLSKITVQQGEAVVRGSRIGYSGNSGYSTGPHLHFVAFASKAVQVTSLNKGDTYYYESRICGTPLHLPISPQNGYLNPLSYL